MAFTWDEKDRLLIEVIMRTPIWRSKVPHTLESKELRFKLEQERDKKPGIGLVPFD